MAGLSGHIGGKEQTVEERKVPAEQIKIRTNYGECPVRVLTPAGVGSWPVVIFYMDGLGIRPAATEMAHRLSEAGYIVLLPDLFYRFHPYTPFVPKEVFAGDFCALVGPLMSTTGNDKAAEDTGAFLAYLDSRDHIAGSKIGAVGFCMGGGMAIAAAGTYPDRFTAAASFHGGNLATDAPTSPHLFVSKPKARIYIAAAENDASYPSEMAARFETALAKSGVAYRAESYAAAYGWMMPDFPVYDHAAADRGRREMLQLFSNGFQKDEMTSFLPRRMSAMAAFSMVKQTHFAGQPT